MSGIRLKKSSITPMRESAAAKRKRTKRIFVVQRHQASTLHYDVRLEINGVLKSWAVPKGPSLNAQDKRLAIMVKDDHVSQASFEGTLPEGNYSSGVVEIWDKGTYEPVGLSGSDVPDRKLLQDLRNGSLKFRLNGKKLRGTFRLLRLKERSDNLWLLIKGNDRYAVEYPYDSEDYVKRQ
jgi:bifunctional non-homologous end joining protein LigD